MKQVKVSYLLLVLLSLFISSCAFNFGAVSPKLKARNSFENKLAARFGKDNAKIIIKYDLLGLSNKKCLISDLYTDVFNQKVSLNNYQIKLNNAYAEFKLKTEPEMAHSAYLKLNELSKRYNVFARPLQISNNKFKPKKSGLVNLLKISTKFDSKFKSVPIIHPVKKYTVTSNYGSRVHPVKGIVKMHNGIDLISKADHYPIYSANDGKVIFAGKESGYGNYVVIDHGNGISTLYAHLSKITVKKGAKINAGQVVGIMGDSGTATAMHLHYEVRINNKPINPASIVKFNNCK